ncbi:MAG TPA: DUF6152 family protein [Terriglobales bacterium]|jgi:hypothetical protein|nr:DUF6152 family protein [Terriglobales bacterium]
MKVKFLVMMAIFAAVLIPVGATFAHHGNVAYDMKDLVVLKNATVTKFFWANPHNILTFDIKDDNGNVVHWVGESGSPAAVSPFGWTRDVVHPGDVITVYIFRAKAGTPVGIINKIVLADGKEFKDVPLGGTEADREEAKKKGIE